MNFKDLDILDMALPAFLFVIALGAYLLISDFQDKKHIENMAKIEAMNQCENKAKSTQGKP